MPPEFDAAWEYYTPDPEIEELLQEIQTEKAREVQLDSFAAVLTMRDDGVTRQPAFGVHFGRGSPDRQTTWVKGEKEHPIPKRKGQRGRAPALLIPKRCPTCTVEFFVIASRDRTYCSRKCIRHNPARLLRAAEAKAKISAKAKARHAANPEWSKQTQAKAVAAAAAQQKRGLTAAQREARRRNMKIAQAARIAGRKAC